jgi:hypothetical protein
LKKIHRKLKVTYDDGAMKWVQVYLWVSEVRWEHENVSDFPRPRWPS